MTIREEFDKRMIEIDLYFEILKTIELDKPKLSAYNLIENQQIEVLFDSEKIKILRANSFLLLYNLIESTIYNSIVSIFDKITDNQIKYFEMIEEVQRYWLNNLYKHDEKKKKETVISTFMNIATQIFNNSIFLTSNEISYGGSLDAQTIFETAKAMKIGIANVLRVYDKNIHGETLKRIKDKRNWLAHGEKSFSEVGDDVTFSQLNEAKNQVKIFLEEFIKSVEEYISNESYRKQSLYSINQFELKNDELTIS